MTGNWSDPPTIWALLLFPETTLACGPSAAPLIFAVKVITRMAPLNPPAGTTNGPHCGVAEPAAGWRREAAGVPLIAMLVGGRELKPCGKGSVTVTAWAASLLSFSSVIT